LIQYQHPTSNSGGCTIRRNRGADITRSAWLTAGNALQRQNIETALEGSRPCEPPPTEVFPLVDPEGVSQPAV